jgi:hypothetical protein
VARREREQNSIIDVDPAQLFAQEELGLTSQRGELVQQRGGDAGLERPVGWQRAQVQLSVGA